MRRRSGLLLGYRVQCVLCRLLRQKHGNDDETAGRCPSGSARQPPSPASTSSSPGGAAGGRNVGGKTTSVVPAAPPSAVSAANKLLKVG